jgi:hypothetical protein
MIFENGNVIVGVHMSFSFTVDSLLSYVGDGDGRLDMLVDCRAQVSHRRYGVVKFAYSDMRA